MNRQTIEDRSYDDLDFDDWVESGYDEELYEPARKERRHKLSARRRLDRFNFERDLKRRLHDWDD